MEGILLHPPLVHFAIVLPVIAMFFQIAYSVSNNATYSKCSAAALVITALVMVATWYTGGLEGEDIYPLLSDEGQATLKLHKTFGLFLMIGVIALALVKVFAYRARSVVLETIVLMGLLVTSSALIYQGLLGGDIVYKYGAGVENHSDGIDCLQEQAVSEEDE